MFVLFFLLDSYLSSANFFFPEHQSTEMRRKKFSFSPAALSQEIKNYGLKTRDKSKAIYSQPQTQ